MFYTIYRVINLCNGKEYIGKHQTQDLEDGYMGSGKLLTRAIKKYGAENFKKEILHVFENEKEMNDKEIELVNEEYCDRKDTYNICTGGQGGFSYINKKGLNIYEGLGENGRKALEKAIKVYKEKLATDEEFRKKISEKNSETMKKYLSENDHPWLGRKHKEETKRKIGKANSRLIGEKNSQYGTMWITNGTENKKIKKELDTIPEGWYKGRVKAFEKFKGDW